MTILDRYLMKRMVATIARVLISLVLLFVVIDFLTHLQDTVSKYDVPWKVVGQYYLASIPRIIFEYHGVPLAVLVAGLMVLGRAAQDNEITAALAGGIGLRRIAAGPIILALVIAVGAFVLQETLGVAAVRDSRRIEGEYFSRFDTMKGKGISWNNLSGGWMCYALKFNRASLAGQDVYIHRITPDHFDEIRARRLWWSPEADAWLIEDGRWMSFDRGKDWEQASKRITQMEAPFTERPEALFALEKSADTKGALELREDIARASSLGLPVRSAEVDYYAKLARPALSFIMVLIAVPFAVRVRRGGVAVSFAASIGIGIVYVLLFYGGLGLGYLAIIPPIVAAWTANIVFLVIGGCLLARAPS